jgi:carbonic anhydrase/acetyltransferase-like protein (isoleucine patch superfamily)
MIIRHPSPIRILPWAVLQAGLLLAAVQPLLAHKIDAKADIHPTAVLMGNVTVGPYTKIGPKVVIQGDVTIGSHVNILGNAIIHASKLTIGDYVRIDYGAKVVDGRPAIGGITANTTPDRQYVANYCWIGMNATVRGSQLEEGSTVGNGAVADFNTRLQKGAILATGAIAEHDTNIPPNALAEGNPAAVTKTAVTDVDRRRILGLIPMESIRQESARIAQAIDANPPKPRQSYGGINGKPFWKGDVKVDPTAQIHPTAILLGPVTVGAHTRIGPNAIVTRAMIGHHCYIGAGTNIRSDTTIGNYVYIGERVHIGSSRAASSPRITGFDNPLWIKDRVFVGPGSVLHATRADDGVYYGANAFSDYGSYVEKGAVVKSGTVVWHDFRIRPEAVAAGNPMLMETDQGIDNERQLKTVGFLPAKWLTEVFAADLERPETYDTPLNGFEHVNKGVVKGTVNPGAILIGNINVGEGTKIAIGAYLEGNITLGKEDDIQVDTMLVSNSLTIGDHTHLYDKAMVVDGRPGDKIHIGVFCWVNHTAALAGAWMDDFSNSNIGTTQSVGTHLYPEALLMNGSATYADSNLPAKSISYGNPAKVRILDSTMRERMVFFYGRDFPTWERQASPEELKQYTLPK